MTIGHIYIKGQIGNSTDSEGNITERGVELQDVIIQVEANKEADTIYCHITSPGGDVHTGRAIANYISSLGNVVTIADGLCGSIATEIHLSVPLENRRIVSGSQYFVHNPLLQGISGNAEELARASEFVKQYQNEMLTMYCKRTGLDKSALEGLMAQETSLTDEQCKSLGFVSVIIPQMELKAVAFLKDKSKTNFNKMDISKAISEGFKTVVAELKKDNETPAPKAAMVETDKGSLSYESEGEAPQVGEVVMIEGEPAEAGDYVTESGMVIKVSEGGIVSEVVEMEVEGNKDEEPTVEELQAKLTELETQNAELVEANKKTKEEIKTELKAEMENEIAEAVKAEVIKFKKSIGSDYSPKGEKAKHTKKPAVVSMRQAAGERKAEYKTKK